MLPHWTEAEIIIGNSKFHYVRTGDGQKPPFILQHGFSDNGLCWLPVARDLEATYDIIMPDSRGHGLSERVHPGQQIDNAADLAALIQALELDKPIIAGHSMGGLTLTELGAKYPQLVGSLILEDPAWIDLPTSDLPVQNNPFFEWLITVEATPIDEVIAIGKAQNPTWADDEFPAWAISKHQLDKSIFGALNMRKPWREFIAALTVPTLLITADTSLGAIITPATAQEATSLSPHIQVAHIPNVGHNVRRENYQAFMQAVQDFLQ